MLFELSLIYKAFKQLEHVVEFGAISFFAETPDTQPTEKKKLRPLLVGLTL